MKSLKLAFISLAIFAVSSFADEYCQTLYDRLLEVIPDQRVRVCFISGQEPDDLNNDKGLWFTLAGEPALLMYSDKEDSRSWLAMGKNDPYFMLVRCVTRYGVPNSEPRYKQMTTKEIALFLMKYKKDCKGEFKP